jgi:hypothetical protein
MYMYYVITSPLKNVHMYLHWIILYLSFVCDILVVLGVNQIFVNEVR